MDVRMDVCGMNEFKEIALTPGQELRPVSDLRQISALRSHHSSLKPEGFVTAQLLILSDQKASACQLQEGKKCYLHSRILPRWKKKNKKKSWLFTCPKQSSLLFAWLERLFAAPTKAAVMNHMQAHLYFALFQLLFCKGPGTHSWEERAALVSSKGDAPTHRNSQERKK